MADDVGVYGVCLCVSGARFRQEKPGGRARTPLSAWRAVRVPSYHRSVRRQGLLLSRHINAGGREFACGCLCARRRPAGPSPVCRRYMRARLTWAGRPRAAGAPSCRPARPALFVCFCRTARAHRQQQQQVTGDWDATIRPACNLMHAWYRTTQVLRMPAYEYVVPTTNLFSDQKLI